MTYDLYRRLQEHLDGMSLGFPAAEIEENLLVWSGVDFG